MFQAPVPHTYAHFFPINGETGTDPATLSDHGRDVTVSFTGGPAGDKPCDLSYTASATGDSHAVAITIIAHPVPTNEACTLQGYNRIATAHLQQPLGGRVLIDGTDGAIITVTTTQH
jgi:hypothetical protein